MQSVWVVVVMHQYKHHGWLNHCDTVFANEEDANAHAEELRAKFNPAINRVIVKCTRYVA